MILSKNLKQKLQESNWVGSKKVPEMEWKKKNYARSKNSKSNGLKWNSAKVLRWCKNRERSRLTPCALTGIRVSIQWSPSNLCSTHPNYKHFASKRGNLCLDLVPTKCLKRRPSYFRKKQCETKNKNLLFSQETCKNWNYSSWKGRTRTAFWKSFIVFSFCLPWQIGMAGADVSGIHFFLLHEFVRFALCIVNNDDLMIFGGHVVYLWPK